MQKEKDQEFDTWMLIEEYEGQANILVGGDGDIQLAANRLFRIRKDMHKKIHCLKNQLKLIPNDDLVICEFCFKKHTKKSDK